MNKKDISLQEKYEIIIKDRGEVLENSVIAENLIKELLLKTGGEIFVIDEEKKELNFHTGSKEENEIGGIRYNNLISSFIYNMERIFEKLSDGDKKNLEENLTKFFSLRAIFAHVPIKYNSQYAEFSDNKIYVRYFKLDKKWRNIAVAKEEFKSIFKWVEELLGIYQKRVSLSEQLMKGMIGIPIDESDDEK